MNTKHGKENNKASGLPIVMPACVHKRKLYKIMVKVTKSTIYIKISLPIFPKEYILPPNNLHI